jgi:predicted dehydrogenase
MTTNILSLEGKTAAVISGTSGIGRTLSLGLADAGADVVASARRREQVDETAAEIERRGRQTLRLCADVCNRTSLGELHAASLRRFGKVEKPCSHNPAEGEMLVQAQQKYRKLVQMGTQQRSSPHTIEIIARIHEEIIGRPYFAKAWYVNTRKSIGTGKEVPVPPQLDWDLWQGPAPRRPYTDNVHPYNWHWFKIYGTGETFNNGTHEVDVCRWALGVDYPARVTSSGGRYQFKDDWQFYDTLVTSFEYGDKMTSWEGKSCQGMKYYGRDRGSTIMGTTGTVLVDRGGYEIYDLKGNKTSEFKAGNTSSSADLIGSDSMTDAHFANFIAGIRKGEKLNAPISVGNVAVTMVQLSNVAWEVNRELHLDSRDGRIQGDPEAMKMWGREHEKGWAPHV